MGCWWLRVLGFGFWVWGLRFKVLVLGLEFTALGLGFGFKVLGLRFRVLVKSFGFRALGLGLGFEFRVWVLGFGVIGLGLRVLRFGCRLLVLGFWS